MNKRYGCKINSTKARTYSARLAHGKRKDTRDATLSD